MTKNLTTRLLPLILVIALVLTFGLVMAFAPSAAVANAAVTTAQIGSSDYYWGLEIGNVDYDWDWGALKVKYTGDPVDVSGWEVTIYKDSIPMMEVVYSTYISDFDDEENPLQSAPSAPGKYSFVVSLGGEDNSRIPFDIVVSDVSGVTYNNMITGETDISLSDSIVEVPFASNDKTDYFSNFHFELEPEYDPETGDPIFAGGSFYGESPVWYKEINGAAGVYCGGFSEVVPGKYILTSDFSLYGYGIACLYAEVTAPFVMATDRYTWTYGLTGQDVVDGIKDDPYGCGLLSHDLYRNFDASTAIDTVTLRYANGTAIPAGDLNDVLELGKYYVDIEYSADGDFCAAVLNYEFTIFQKQLVFEDWSTPILSPIYYSEALPTAKLSGWEEYDFSWELSEYLLLDPSHEHMVIIGADWCDADGNYYEMPETPDAGTYYVKLTINGGRKEYYTLADEDNVLTKVFEYTVKPIPLEVDDYYYNGVVLPNGTEIQYTGLDIEVIPGNIGYTYYQNSITDEIKITYPGYADVDGNSEDDWVPTNVDMTDKITVTFSDWMDSSDNIHSNITEPEYYYGPTVATEAKPGFDGNAANFTIAGTATPNYWIGKRHIRILFDDGVELQYADAEQQPVARYEWYDDEYCDYENIPNEMPNISLGMGETEIGDYTATYTLSPSDYKYYDIVIDEAPFTVGQVRNVPYSIVKADLVLTVTKNFARWYTTNLNSAFITGNENYSYGGVEGQGFVSDKTALFNVEIFEQGFDYDAEDPATEQNLLPDTWQYKRVGGDWTNWSAMPQEPGWYQLRAQLDKDTIHNSNWAVWDDMFYIAKAPVYVRTSETFEYKGEAWSADTSKYKYYIYTPDNDEYLDSALGGYVSYVGNAGCIANSANGGSGVDAGKHAIWFFLNAGSDSDHFQQMYYPTQTIDEDLYDEGACFEITKKEVTTTASFGYEAGPGYKTGDYTKRNLQYGEVNFLHLTDDDFDGFIAESEMWSDYHANNFVSNAYYSFSDLAANAEGWLPFAELPTTTAAGTTVYWKYEPTWKNHYFEAELGQFNIEPRKARYSFSDGEHVVADENAGHGGAEGNPDLTYVYDGNSHIPTVTVTNPANGETIRAVYSAYMPNEYKVGASVYTYDYEGYETDTINVGLHVATVNAIEIWDEVNEEWVTATNYVYSNGINTGCFWTITKKEILVTAKSFTNAGENALTYGDQEPEYDYTMSGFVTGDEKALRELQDENFRLTGEVPTSSTYSWGSTAADTYTTYADVTNLSAWNYYFTEVYGTIEVNKAKLTVKPNQKTRTYGDVEFVQSDFAWEAVNAYQYIDSKSQINDDDVEFVCDYTRWCSTDGTYTITMSGLASDDYWFDYQEQALTYNKADFEISVKQTKASQAALTYNGTATEAAAVEDWASTVLNGQTVTFKYSTTNGSGYAEGVPAIAEEGNHTVYFEASAPNHNPYYGSFNVYVNKRNITVTLPGGTWEYGADDISVGTIAITEDGLGAGDDLDDVCFYGFNLGATTNVDNYFVSLSSRNNSNYNATLYGADYNIVTRKLTVDKWLLDGEEVAEEAFTFTYDGKKHTLTAVLNGLKNEQSVTLEYLNNEKTDVSASPASVVAKTYSADGEHYNYEVVTAATNRTRNWEITRKSITGATITLGEDPSYDGTTKSVTITSVTVDDLTLTADDYSIADASDQGINADFYTLTINGTGNFQDSASKGWAITPYVIGGMDISIHSVDTAYDGAAHEYWIKADVPVQGFTVAQQITLCSSTITNVADSGYWTLPKDSVYSYGGSAYNNYILGAATTVYYNITKATPSFTAPTAREYLNYTGETQLLITAGEVSNIYGNLIEYSFDQESWTKNATEMFKTAQGTYPVYYRILETINYYGVAVASVDGVINPKGLTIMLNQIAGKTYDGAALATPVYETDFTVSGWTGTDTDALITGANAGKVTIEYKVQGADGGYTEGMPTAANTYLIRVRIHDLANYGESVGEQTVTIDPRPVELSWTDASNFVYDGTAKTVSATVTNVVGNDTFTLEYSGNTEETAAYDNYLATLSGLGNDNYTLVGVNADYYWSIKPATLTIAELDDLSTTYGTAVVEPTIENEGIVITGWVNGESVDLIDDELQIGYALVEGDVMSIDEILVAIGNGDIEFSGCPTAAGTYYVGVSLVGLANYSNAYQLGVFTIAKKELTVTATSFDVTYGDAVPTYEVTYNGFAYEDDEDDLDGTLAFACDYATTSAVGEYAIVASGYESDNYTFDYVDGSVTVGNATLTDVSVEQATALTYNGKAQVAEVNTAATAVNKMPVTFTYSITDNSATGEGYGAEVLPFKNWAKNGYTVYYKATAANHNDAFGSFVVTIGKKAATITIDKKASVYGNEPVALTAVDTNSALVDDDAYEAGKTPLPYTLACSVTSASGAGKYAITGTSINPNYDITFVGEAEAYEVTKANLTLSVSVADTIYGTAVTAPIHSNANDKGITITGWKNNDKAETLLNKANMSLVVLYFAKNADMTFEQQYAYEFGQINFNDQAAVMAFMTQKSAVPTQAGEYYVFVKAQYLANYNNIEGYTHFTIAKADMTITANYSFVVYGDENPAFTVRYEGWKYDDATKAKSDVFTGTLGFDTNRVLTSPFGNYTVTPKGYTAGNYTITFVPGTLRVERAELDCTIEVEDVVYGTAVKAPVIGNGIKITGWKNDDTAALINTEEMQLFYVLKDGNKTVGEQMDDIQAEIMAQFDGDPDAAAKIQAAYAAYVAEHAAVPTQAGTYYVLFGVDNFGSYWGIEAFAEFTIEQKVITVTADDKESDYEAALVPLTVSGAIEEGDVVCTIATTADNTKVGTYPITLTSTNNPNYVVTLVNGTYTIKAKAAKVETNAAGEKVVENTEKISEEAAKSSEGVNITNMIQNVINAAADAPVVTLEFAIGEDATVAFDKAALVKLAQNGDVKITYTETKAEDIDTGKKEFKNAQLVIEISLAGASFDGGKATISTAFENKAPGGKKAVLYFVDENGKKTDMKATFADGTVTFETGHFSTYIVEYKLTGGAIAGIVIACVVAAAGIAVGVFFLLKKKGAKKEAAAE